jgi:hypothetical protein
MHAYSLLTCDVPEVYMGRRGLIEMVLNSVVVSARLTHHWEQHNTNPPAPPCSWLKIALGDVKKLALPT